MTMLATAMPVRVKPRWSAPGLRAAQLAHPEIGLRNLCMLRLLERIALHFQEAGIALLALKGAALNLTIHDRPDARPMSDLDIMIRPSDALSATSILQQMGCRAGRPLVRADFFPRFYYERDFLLGGVLPLRIDLHVRPFRPLRYAVTVPPEAFWEGACRVRVGRAEVLVPDVEDMLLHLAVHSAVHGNQRLVWLADLKHWADAQRGRLDWEKLWKHAAAWGLVRALHSALECAEKEYGEIRPAAIRTHMAAYRASWRERLTLRQSPDDSASALRHVLTETLCTPGWSLRAGHLRAMLLPDRGHLAEWYDHRHAGWPAAARVLRLLSPLLRRVAPLWNRVARAEVRDTPRGPGVFARRRFVAGESVFTFSARDPGKLACVRHSCQPNARRDANCVRALKFIAPGDEIRVDQGIHACDCRRCAPPRTGSNTHD